ncbi:DNA replication terminus site-binding protein [Acerihabitans sp. TG2]|uniref:DNA replication terminus site-binding protein n=1 Tax=Acerihabitans sp. TG2 TaxID=3096008 RepID=UPI002B229EDD|nr:DNA replication terminus site-binding protein [Acerihabitans sp. TG2]MEA9391148.1 DNA replication terminus site-binding protein [Acerihabitans sp. TG2]
MPALDLIARLNEHFTQLQSGLSELQSLLGDFRLLVGRVFELPEIEKGQEQAALDVIPVTQHVGTQALALGLAHFQRMFIYHQKQNTSAKAAIRLPGALCFAVDDKQYQAALTLIEHINRMKTALSHMITVESQLPPEQRFAFVHHHLRGLKTLSAYRSLSVITDPWSLRFGWANKHIIKNLTRQQVLEMLQKSLAAGRAVPHYDKQQWAEKVREEIDTISKLPPTVKLKIKRPVKVQPIARVWYQDRQQQVQLACPSPLVVLCRVSPDETLPPQIPQLGELLSYDQASIRHKYKPPALPAHLVIERLHLYVAT